MRSVTFLIGQARCALYWKVALSRVLNMASPRRRALARERKSSSRSWLYSLASCSRSTEPPLDDGDGGGGSSRGGGVAGAAGGVSVVAAPLSPVVPGEVAAGGGASDGGGGADGAAGTGSGAGVGAGC